MGGLLLYLLLCVVIPLAWGLAVAWCLNRRDQPRRVSRAVSTPTEYEI